VRIQRQEAMQARLPGQSTRGVEWAKAIVVSR
jgi:hypothetical protein